MKPLVFKIKPSKASRLYFTVRVFSGVREARRLQKLRKGRKNTNTTGRWFGLCTQWGWCEINGVRKFYFGDEVGEILLSRKSLGASIVTHECTHAMFALLRRWRLVLPEDPIGIPEERACYALGDMVKQIYDKLYATGYC